MKYILIAYLWGVRPKIQMFVVGKPERLFYPFGWDYYWLKVFLDYVSICLLDKPDRVASDFFGVWCLDCVCY